MGVKGGAAVIDEVPDNIDSLDWIKGDLMELPPEIEPQTLNLALESGSFRGAIIDGLLTLYHKKLCAVLTEFGVDNIQFYPVLLRDQETQKIEDSYFIVNIVGLFDCIDMQKSKVEWWRSGMGFNFLSMVIDETKTYGLPVFRLKDDPTKVLLVKNCKILLPKKINSRCKFD